MPFAFPSESAFAFAGISMVEAGRFERPTPCAQDGFRTAANRACFQLLLFQTIMGCLLKLGVP
jgi:hypothetical protein